MTATEQILAIVKDSQQQQEDAAERFRQVVKDVVDSSPEVEVLEEEE